MVGSCNILSFSFFLSFFSLFSPYTCWHMSFSSWLADKEKFGITAITILSLQKKKALLPKIFDIEKWLWCCLWLCSLPFLPLLVESSRQFYEGRWKGDWENGVRVHEWHIEASSWWDFFSMYMHTTHIMILQVHMQKGTERFFGFGLRKRVRLQDTEWWVSLKGEWEGICLHKETIWKMGDNDWRNRGLIKGNKQM